MKKNRVSLWAIRLLLPITVIAGASAQQTIDFCNFELPSAIVRGNATFTAVYAFDVNSSGTPQNVQAVEKAFVKSEDAQKCITDWKLPDYSHKHLVASFEWRHAIGWTKLGISGEGVSLTIRLSGQKCPYCTKGTDVPSEKTKPTPTMH
jgi:hypothetical protein